MWNVCVVVAILWEYCHLEINKIVYQIYTVAVADGSEESQQHSGDKVRTSAALTDTSTKIVFNVREFWGRAGECE